MAPPGDRGIRERLRAATADAHERLHRHDGFGAAARGTIRSPEYVRLLARLWGFHRAFENALAICAAQDGVLPVGDRRRRSSMLEADLAAFGWERASILAIPKCDWLTQPRNSKQAMGALYVVEGSALGGLQIARALAPLCEPLGGKGRSFFLGHGEGHSANWRGFLARLEESATTLFDDEEIIHGATATFLDFESWMIHWNSPLKTTLAAPQVEEMSGKEI